MITKELPISDSAKKFLLLIVVAGAIFALTASVAFAFHPGEDRNGNVPQGPHQTACDNEGRQGVDVAVTNGGAVHCERGAVGF